MQTRCDKETYVLSRFPQRPTGGTVESGDHCTPIPPQNPPTPEKDEQGRLGEQTESPPSTTR
ncbi:hypothetical protein NHX12_002664, partial [Muraenolepis orangiensis]